MHKSMHELPPWLPYAPDDKQGHDNAAVRKREDTAELHRKKKSEAIESCFLRPTYELDIGRGSARARDHPPALMLYAPLLPNLHLRVADPTVLYTEFVNLAQRISSRNRLKNACYIVSRDPR